MEDEIDPIDADGPPDWIEDAYCINSYAYALATAPAFSNQAVDACDALNDAGIPCHVSREEDDPEADDPHVEFRLLVPIGKMLDAQSVLAVHIGNPEQEATWRMYLENLSDEDFDALEYDSIAAGNLDRVERLQRAYEDELARRRPADED